MSLGTMKPSELRVLARQGDCIFVIAPHGTNGYDWPTPFEWRDARYRFVCNEPITGDMDAGGYAKYELIAKRTCGQCGGKGYIDTPAMKCAFCGGSGVVAAAQPAPAPEPTRSQKLAAAGFTRRPTWRSLPPEDDAQEPTHG